MIPEAVMAFSSTKSLTGYCPCSGCSQIRKILGEKKIILHAETEFQEANAKSLKKKFPSTTMNSFF